MPLPVLSVGSKTVITVGAAGSDNQITLVGGQKYVWQLVGSAPVGLTLWGPFTGAVDPALKKGLGQLAISGTSLKFGNTVRGSGSYLVELASGASVVTVELTVRPWGSGFNGLVDTVMSWFWRFTNK